VDISHTLEPQSEQLDAIDLLTGPRIFTIERVTKGNAEQPVQIHLSGFPRPWRPGKSMRRVLVACWGAEASQYAGRRVELYCDPTVVFGGQAVGGTRISRLSHIDKPRKVPLLVSRGKSAIWTVEPLPDSEPTSPAVSAETLAELTTMFRRKGIPEDKWLAGTNHYTKGAATALEVITEDQAQRMLTELGKRPDAEPATDPWDTPAEGEQ
jgi:hypothetical protein